MHAFSHLETTTVLGGALLAIITALATVLVDRWMTSGLYPDPQERFVARLFGYVRSAFFGACLGLAFVGLIPLKAAGVAMVGITILGVILLSIALASMAQRTLVHH